jgi:hypothetical protein
MADLPGALKSELLIASITIAQGAGCRLTPASRTI